MTNKKHVIGNYRFFLIESRCILLGGYSLLKRKTANKRFIYNVFFVFYGHN